MVTIKWSNGDSNYKTTFYKPFKRLDNCNAAMFEVSNTTTQNALQHTIKVTRYGFVSYDTPICIITQFDDMTKGTTHFNVKVNRNMYNCSNSTIHQFVRFLRYSMGNLLTYHDIKHYDKQSGYYKDIAISDVVPMHIYWYDTIDLRYAMENLDAIWSTNHDI